MSFRWRLLLQGEMDGGTLDGRCLLPQDREVLMDDAAAVGREQQQIPTYELGGVLLVNGGWGSLLVL